ncbi:MAG: hypothetical protein AB1349_03100 [Elusimicrobiota bacterium]
MPNVYEQVKQALQDIVAPEIRELKTEIKRLDEKIDSKHNELLSEIKRLDEKIDSGLTRLDEKIELTLEFRERFSALEVKVAALTASR